jgi:signal transduction histidine kinase
MINPPFAPVYLRDPRLAPHIAGAAPVWVWSTGGTRIIWANAAAAAVFGAVAVSDLVARTFDAADPAAAQIARLAGSLQHGAAPRLERLRGFGSGVLRLMICACSRIGLDDQTPAILVVGKETVEPPLSLSERLRRLFEGAEQPIAIFAPGGALAYATARGHGQIGNAQTLVGLGADALAQEALRAGWSTGIIACGRVICDRIGEGTDALIAVTFTAQNAQSAPIITATAQIDERAPVAVGAGFQNVVPFRPATSERVLSDAQPAGANNVEAAYLREREQLEQDLRAAVAQAEEAKRRLDQAKVQPALTGALSHQIRGALNSIIGFSETMLEERFGPIGNERYRGYLEDIHTAGEQVTKLLHGLVGVSDITGVTRKSDLLNLSEVVQGCVAQLQPQASRAHVLIRASLTPGSTVRTSDAHAVRQLVVDLLMNAVRSTGAGSQVIVSTAITAGTDGGAGDVILRVRDTGSTLAAPDAGAGVEPSGAEQTPGAMLAIAKGFAEANGARFAIASGPSEGTLVEVTFPAAARAASGGTS